jgi:predicted lipase
LESQAIKLISEITELKEQDAKNAGAIQKAENERRGYRNTEKRNKVAQEAQAVFLEKQKEAVRRSLSKVLFAGRPQMIISQKKRISKEEPQVEVDQNTIDYRTFLGEMG